jgi:hypothetical protein
VKKLISLVLLCFCVAGFLAAQEPPPADSSKKEETKEAEPILAFDLNIAPNTNGALEGSVMLGLRWSPWFETDARFSVSSFVTVYDENGGSTTSIDSNKNLDIDIVKTRSSLLRIGLGSDDSYIALNLSVLLDVAWLNREKYGYGNPGPYSFFSKQDIFYLYPFGNGELEFKLGPFALNGYFRQSIFDLYTSVTGENFSSAVGLGVVVPFSTTDRGYETRFGGTAVLTPLKELEFRYNFEYKRHIGYTVGYAGGVNAEYVYEAVEMAHTLTVSVDIYGYRPLIGVSYVTDTFAPVHLYSIKPFSNSRFRFIFGMVYK